MPSADVPKRKKPRPKAQRPSKAFTVEMTPKSVGGKKSTVDFQVKSSGLTKKELKEIVLSTVHGLLQEDPPKSKKGPKDFDENKPLVGLGKKTKED